MMLTESACLAVALDAADQQRQILEKIAENRIDAIELRLNLDDARTELVNVTAWAEDIPAEQKIALDEVARCQRLLARNEAEVARLQAELCEVTSQIRRP